METWNRLTAARGKWGGVEWWKEGEGTSQRICMNDPQTWTRCGDRLWEWGGSEQGKEGKNRRIILNNNKKEQNNESYNQSMFCILWYYKHVCDLTRIHVILKVFFTSIYVFLSGGCMANYVLCFMKASIATYAGSTLTV